MYARSINLSLPNGLQAGHEIHQRATGEAYPAEERLFGQRLRYRGDWPGQHRIAISIRQSQNGLRGAMRCHESAPSRQPRALTSLTT